MSAPPKRRLKRLPPKQKPPYVSDKEAREKRQEKREDDREERLRTWRAANLKRRYKRAKLWERVNRAADDESVSPKIHTVQFTPSVRFILSLVSSGFTCKESSQILGCSEMNVRKHLLRAKKQSGARTIPQLVAVAIVTRQLFVDDEDPDAIQTLMSNPHETDYADIGAELRLAFPEPK